MAAAIPGLSIMTALTLFAQRMFVGIDVFLLLAIPLFIRRRDHGSRRYGATPRSILRVRIGREGFRAVWGMSRS